ncbi:hypothetical protein HMPREF0765_2860 [Sphingobacterium spiritivorum ATCC 33300]|uniref:Uncharacterized protein n=1 Tax=Sphingobacterium spiritivorum ATCC 33300 TaxID=525372 RepID=C2FZV4_SPHSI|nr:hypothetical protein HMPREF0765_2860 [Sphingobacterium spiritivorum ATCC 33300]
MINWHDKVYFKNMKQYSVKPAKGLFGARKEMPNIGQKQHLQSSPLLKRSCPRIP